MKKLLLFITICILATAVVFAAGSTAGAVKKTDRYGNSEINCEGFSVAKNRIKCRLQNDKDAYGNPEPCRALSSNQAEACVQLYTDSLPCYKKRGTEKDACFKGLTIAKDASSKREYILLLLYDLEEIAEEGFEDNLLTAEETATVIDDIVSIKINVMKFSPKSQIKSELAALKASWPEVLS
jgi:hypothetical protein|tara:strand:+ start:420 stop:965 length:546 start_codon:yes stop_codon:yes gene_type:complete